MVAADFSPRRAAAIEARGTSFEMQTNIKARPGSQGTLFQGGKPVAQHRWPRGYSPSRMAAVGGALTLGGGGIHVSADPLAGNSEYPGLSHPHLNPSSEAHTRRLILEPLARSTYHVPDITNLAGGIHLRVNAGTTPGEAAHYSPQSRTINVNRQTHKGDARTQLAKADAVLIHEMGHHVDITHHGYDYEMQMRRRQADFPDQDPMEHGLRGQLEHNADANMIQHFRNDPRNQRATGVDVRKLTYGGRGVASAAGAGYTDPGAETLSEKRDRLVARKIESHRLATGKVASPSVLHPGQFDEQQAMF